MLVNRLPCHVGRFSVIKGFPFCRRKKTPPSAIKRNGGAGTEKRQMAPETNLQHSLKDKQNGALDNLG